MMLNEIIKEYQMKAHFIGEDEEKLWYSADGGYALVMRYENVMHPDVNELADLCQQIGQDEHFDFVYPMKNKRGKWITSDSEDDYVAFFLIRGNSQKHQDQLGKVLGEFHKKSQAYSFKNNVPYPYYYSADFWMRRTEQIKKWYLDTLQKEDPTPAEKLFLSVYPYYLGRAENAIQYIIDLRMDIGIEDPPTLCHHRLDAEFKKLNYSPSWVVDHPARDIAEWIRTKLDQEATGFESIRSFIDEYHEVIPLKASGYGVIYARLLFPTTFFDVIDRLFTRDEDQVSLIAELEHVFHISKSEEQFLIKFADEYMTKLRKVDWLK